MAFIRKKSKTNVHMMKNYPASNPSMFKDKDYIICCQLIIGYFALACGRLVFLPIEEKDLTYQIYQETE